jgi:hypothetical protein
MLWCRFFSEKRSFLPKSDCDSSDESFTIDHRSTSVVAIGSTVPKIFILYDHHGIGPHAGCLFAKLVFDKIPVHPGFGPDPDIAQFDVTPFRPTLDEHDMIRVVSGEMRRAGIKPVAGIRAA